MHLQLKHATSFIALCLLHNCNSLQMYANVCFDYLCHLHSPVIVYAILQQHFRSLVQKALNMHSSNFDQLHKVTPLAGGVAQSALLVEHETPMARAPSHQTPWWANVDPGRLVRFEVFRAADMVTTFQENSSKDFFFEFLSVSWNKECKFTKILGRTTAAIYIQPENHEDIEIWHLPGRFLTTGFYYENILNHFRVSSHSYHILHPWVRPADQDFSRCDYCGACAANTTQVAWLQHQQVMSVGTRSLSLWVPKLQSSFQDFSNISGAMIDHIHHGACPFPFPISHLEALALFVGRWALRRLSPALPHAALRRMDWCWIDPNCNLRAFFLSMPLT